MQKNKKFRISKLLGICFTLIKYKFNPRPKVYWCLVLSENDPYAIFTKNNFGDMLTPYLVEKLTGTKPIYFNPRTVVGAKYIKHSFMIGSILNYSNMNSIVWGSGILCSNVNLECKTVLAVRGKYTARRLSNLGITDIPILGDPGLIFPIIYSPALKKTYEVSIIPHFIDYQIVSANYSCLNVIDVMTNNVEDVIDEIIKSQKIISSSLHGLIIAHAYNIPAVWVKFSDKLDGDDTKFFDYFSSVDLQISHPVILSSGHYSLESSLNYVLPKPCRIKKIQNDLLRTFPYKHSIRVSSV